MAKPILLCLALAAAAAAADPDSPARPADRPGDPSRSTREYAAPSQVVELAADRLGEPGYLLHWLALGSFPCPGGRTLWSQPVPADIDRREADFFKDYLSPSGGEADIAPVLGASVRCADGKDHTWEAIAADPADGRIDLCQHFLDRHQDTVATLAYLAAFVRMDHEQRAILSIGSDDGYRLWVNGEFVVSHHCHRGLQVDDDLVPVRFRAGTNLILLKVNTDTAGWGAIVRLIQRGYLPCEGASELADARQLTKEGAR